MSIKKLILASVCVLVNTQGVFAKEHIKDHQPKAEATTVHTTDRFNNQVIFITGGTSGIGLVTAIEFVKNGAAHVIVTGRSEEKWKKAQTDIAKELNKTQAKVIEFWSSDVRIESQMKAAIERIYDTYGRLDVAFNNAGVQPGDVTSSGNFEDTEFNSFVMDDGSISYNVPGPQPNSKSGKKDTLWKSKSPLQSTPISDYRESEVATSIFGTYYSLKWEIAGIFQRQPKDIPVSIINTSSRNGIIPDPRRTLYAASKAFIIAMTRSLSSQLAQRSVNEKRAMVRINVVAPGPVDTPLERGAYPGTDEEFVAGAGLGVPMQRVATSDEIAPTVLFLADSKSSSYITGAVIPVDGGHVASPLLKRSK